MKYIDAEKLKAEIERLKQLNEISDDKNYAQYELDMACGYDIACEEILDSITYLQQETSEISLERFTEKMKDWKARFNCSDDIPIKATMAFTARMFYMYPDIARRWYDGLPKVTQD